MQRPMTSGAFGPLLLGLLFGMGGCLSSLELKEQLANLEARQNQRLDALKRDLAAQQAPPPPNDAA